MIRALARIRGIEMANEKSTQPVNNATIVYKLTVTMYALATIRAYKRLTGTLSGVADFVADAFRRATMAGMLPLPADLTGALLADVKRMEKNGSIRALLLPENVKDFCLYVPAAVIASLKRAGALNEDDAKICERIEKRDKGERAAFTAARKAATVMLRVRATIEALDNGTLETYQTIAMREANAKK
jgi:hypothetical protein